MNLEITVPTVEMLMTFGGLSVFTTAVVEVILRAWRPDPDTQDRFGPVLAYVVAIASALAAAIYVGGDPAVAVITGVMVGWSSMGVHDSAKAIVGR